MIRRPPRSTLFPTRRSSDLNIEIRLGSGNISCLSFLTVVCDHIPDGRVLQRSEEHTSELQSHVNLVCRLLLEKKKIILDKIEIMYFSTSVRFIYIILSTT